ncbi:hypothetical protein DW766_15215, partial [Butyricicoccus sp. AM29-23AC]
MRARADRAAARAARTGRKERALRGAVARAAARAARTGRKERALRGAVARAAACGGAAPSGGALAVRHRSG